MTENNQQKEEGDIDKILKESKDMDINFEKIKMKVINKIRMMDLKF